MQFDRSELSGKRAMYEARDRLASAVRWLEEAIADEVDRGDAKVNAMTLTTQAMTWLEDDV